MEQSRGSGSRLRSLLAVLLFELVSATAITRHDFPEGFVFGAGSSAYQVRSKSR
jgi:beta-glucosidase